MWHQLTGRAWPAWMGFGVAAWVGYIMIPSVGAASLFSAMTGLVSLGLGVWGVRRHRSALVTPWLVFFGGQLAWSLGDLAYAGYAMVLGHQPYPSVADWLYVSAYPLLGVGLYLLTRERGARSRLELVDTLIIATGLCLVYWLLVIQPIATESEISVAGRLVTIALPTGGVLLCAVLLPLLARSRRRTPSVWLLSMGSAAALGGSALYTLVANPAPLLLKVVYGAFLFSYLCFGGAALHPSGHIPVAVRDAQSFGRGQLALMTAASLLVPAMLLKEGLTSPGSISWQAIMIGSVVLFLLVLTRLSGFVNQVQEQAGELEALAMTDDLTGLANRRQFEQRLRAALAGGEPQVAMLDLNGFKAINDRFGHAVGDLLLSEVAARLSTGLRGADVVARMGGDEFAVLVPGAPACAMDAIVERLRSTLRTPIVVGGNELLVTASFGVADAGDTDDPYEVLRRADVAMYAAKTAGGGRSRRFTPAMDEQLDEHARLGADIRTALDTGQFHLVYQPIVELPTGRIMSVEALIRWQHPEHGFIGPDTFIPVAERNGLIVELGAWVLQTACAQAVTWRDTFGDLAPSKMSVNVSARQLAEPDFLHTVTEVLAWSGLRADDLIVEITETAVFEGGQTVRTVNALHQLGVQIALDDFGTGHSSLTLLHTVPVDVLKVDKSFIDSITESGRHAVIAAALIHVSDGLGLTAVAEGVETVEQAHELYRLGYRRAQGYLFSKPVTQPDFRIPTPTPPTSQNLSPSIHSVLMRHC